MTEPIQKHHSNAAIFEYTDSASEFKIMNDLPFGQIEMFNSKIVC